MSSEQRRSDPKRTAILAVHGMGSQRPFDTVRGIIDAIWLQGQNPGASGKRMWTHPEQNGVDIDLPVATTKSTPQVDFHELYWAHLMSETRAVAVLLWLFELARRGPHLKRRMRGLYWGVLSFLALLILSVSLLAIQFVVLFVGKIAQLTGGFPVNAKFQAAQFQIDFEFLWFVRVALATFTIVLLFISFAAMYHKAFRLAGWAVMAAAMTGLGLVAVFWLGPFEILTNVLLPTLVALALATIAMGRPGLCGLLIAYASSVFGFVILLVLLVLNCSPDICSSLRLDYSPRRR